MNDFTSRDTDLLDPFTALTRAGELNSPDDSPDAAVLAARAAVRRAATTETLHAKVQRRRRIRSRVLVGAAGLVAASLVIGGVVLRPDGGGPLGTQSAAAAVLERAAQAAEAEPELTVGPGQYLKRTVVQQSWTTSIGSNGTLVGSDGRLVVSQERRTRSIWIPYAIDSDWTFRVRTKVLRNNTADPRYQQVLDPSDNQTWTQPSWADDNGNRLETYDPDWYATLSRDPQTLMRQIMKGSTAEGSGTAYDFQEIYSEVLRGLAPPDIRAALFRGLADSPGMVVEHGVSTLDGRTGVALGAADSTWRMVFDVETGAYIGERASDPDFPDEVEGLDADGATWLTSVTTEVVDSAPRATRAP